jgi:hypothetical protein
MFMVRGARPCENGKSFIAMKGTKAVYIGQSSNLRTCLLVCRSNRLKYIYIYIYIEREREREREREAKNGYPIIQLLWHLQRNDLGDKEQ